MQFLVSLQFFVVFGLFFSASPAKAQWAEAVSDNFIFAGQTTEDKAKDIVAEFEDFRAHVLGWSNIDSALNEKRPVRIFGLYGRKAFMEIYPDRSVGGVYKRIDLNPKILLDLKEQVGRGLSSKHLAKHEYVHHLNHSFGMPIPLRWYDEGLAEYLATFHMKNGTPHMNCAKERMRPSLIANKGNIISMKKMLSARKYPKSERQRGRLYVMGCLAVQYIHSQPEMAEKLPVYFNRVNAGEDGAEAFEAVYGIKVRDFETQIRRYWFGGGITPPVLENKPLVAQPIIKTRTLTPRETAGRKSEAMVTFYRTAFDETQSKNMSAHFDKIAAQFGPNADLYANQSWLALTQTQYNHAISLAQKALDLDADHFDARYRHADAQFHKFMDEGAVKISEINNAREQFKALLHHSAKENAVKVHYLQSLLWADGPTLAPETVTEYIATEYMMSMPPLLQMAVAFQYDQQGKHDTACELLQKANITTGQDKAAMTQTRLKLSQPCVSAR